MKRAATRTAAAKKVGPAKRTRTATRTTTATRAAATTHGAPAVQRTGDGPILLARLATQLEERLRQVERGFEEAKQGFETTSRTRASSVTGPHRQLQKDLDAHATQMRLFTVRRTELLWLKRLLQGDVHDEA